MSSNEACHSETRLASGEFARRHDLDALRAFAMLLGIALHAGLSFVRFGWPVEDSRQNEWLGLIFAAVHGFRMPLFFLISGFFTAMLWRKRGLQALLWHRFRRIFLPLLLGLVTVIPAVNWIGKRAITSALDTHLATANDRSDIYAAARAGDLEAIERHLADGGDVNAAGPGELSPIMWAALSGKTPAVGLLIKKGADVNAPSGTGATPLHLAAFMGRAETAALLLQNGAAVDTRNHRGETPADGLAADWKTTQFVAELLQMEVDEEEVTQGRSRVAALLRQPGASADLRLVESGEQGTLNSPEDQKESLHALGESLMYASILHHLWFLWFLCCLVVGFAVYAAIADHLKWSGPARWWVVSPVRFLWLIPLTMIPQWFMGLVVPGFGPDTSAGILPIPHVLFYYALFFGFGALYFDCQDEEGRLGSWWWLTLPVALLVVFPVGLELTMGVFGLRERISPELRRPLSVASQVIFAWMMTFGLMGLCRKLLMRENKTIRYVSDSSYWLYVAHLPLVIGAQLMVRDWPLSASVKYTFVSVVVTAILLVTYQMLVRYTWLGTLLNGARTRPPGAVEAIVADA